ncbi:reprolysin-like metallopeptidase [Flavobacterium sp. 9R]|uniref:reprolysin-like metallopeptidase n=1 Tax=Flavobacterium sp. 9R TaxID=2653143 RepID=UPI00135CDCC3|nr:zinc-dependent metalloprotease family protein [Flavobacterium sp. 9R]
MKKKILFLVLFCVSTLVQAQDKVFWKRVSTAAISSRTLATDQRSNEGLYELNVENLKATLAITKGKKEEVAKEIISFPNADGTMERFLIWETSNFDPILQAKFPTVQSFSGKGITDPNATIYFSTSEKGIQTMVLRSNGQPAEFMEPIKGETQKYVLYRSDKKAKGELPLNCTTDEKEIASNLSEKAFNTKSSDRVFRTMRLALSCTGEYTAYHGKSVQGALAAMNATMTRVNGVFNRDLALKLIIIADYDKVIFTDAATDPYTAVTGGKAPTAWNQELQTTLTNTIGEGSYDIGHLFGASGGGGNAGCIGCVCDTGKGSAYTSPSNDKPEGDTFDIDFVAHEFGHQLGATHTFSHEIEDTGTNVEPGSGSTIMGYAGITDYDVQSNSDDYFAYASIAQIQQNLAPKECPVPTAITNAVFGVNAGSDYTIPKSTPFVLKGTTSGTVNGSFTYVWEQNDSAVTTAGANSIAIPDKADGPLFRSFPPTASLTRYFPAYNNVLINRFNSTWESLSSIARTMTFVFTARDNAALGSGQTASDEMLVTVSGTAGPFEVTSQASTDLSWTQGATQTVTWNVNDTNILSGAANVNIKLSTDGGLTFPITLVSNTPNDGSQSIVVPNVTALKCRILVEPTNSIFYSMNPTPFAIGYTTVSACNTYTFTTPITIPDGVSSYTTRQIVVPADLGSIINVDVEVALSHTYMSDVELEIVSPQNTTVRLLQRVCGSSTIPLTLKIDDSGNVVDCANSAFQIITPTDLLSGFNSQEPAGTWTLRVRDAYVNDSGTISSASVTICTQKATLGTEQLGIADFKLFPNPSDGNFKIEFSSVTSSPVVVSVVDVLGRKVFQKQYENASNFSETLDLKKIMAGVYVVTVEDGDRKEVKKIVVQ